MRTRDCLRIVMKEKGKNLPEGELLALANRKSRLSYERLAAENPVVPGTIETLRTLARDFRLGLASSASKESVMAFLDANDLRLLFATVLHGGDVERAKPDPEIYLRSCAEMALPPADCLVIEDSIAGIQAAKAAGIFTVGIAATCPASDLLAAGADDCIARLEDLVPLIATLCRFTTVVI
jgi:beta-phosphoglucomutase